MQPVDVTLRHILRVPALPPRRPAFAPLAGLIAAAALLIVSTSSTDAQNTAPPAPVGVTVSTWGQDLLVDIDPPADTSNITCYYVRWRTAVDGATPAGDWQPSDNGRVPKLVLRAHLSDVLTANTTYDVEVRSYSEDADLYSDWVAASGTTGGGSSDAALSSLVLSHGTSSVVSLTPAFSPDGCCERAVYRGTVVNSVASINLTPTERTDGTTIKVNGTVVESGSAHAIALAEGKNAFKIWVVAEDERYRWFYQLEITREAGTLAAPTNLVVTQTDSPTWPQFVFTVSWTPPDGATGSVLEYRQVRSVENNGWRSEGITNLTTTGGTISARLHGKELTDFRVASTNNSGNTIGAYATEVIRTYAPPDKLNQASVTPGDQQLVVTWSPPNDSGGKPVEYYLVRHREKPDKADCCPWVDSMGNEIAGTRVNSGLTHTITGLTNDTAYEVQVVAIAAFGLESLDRRWSPAVSGTPTMSSMQQLGRQRFGVIAVEAPGKVVHLMVGASGRRITVSWLAPESGGAPAQYIVRLKDTDGGKAKFKRPDADVQVVRFGKLERGKTYRVSVRAKNDLGSGKWSHAEVSIPLRTKK